MPFGHLLRGLQTDVDESDNLRILSAHCVFHPSIRHAAASGDDNSKRLLFHLYQPPQAKPFLSGLSSTLILSYSKRCQVNCNAFHPYNLDPKLRKTTLILCR